jgi:large subunit ribosomal protein L9
MEIILKEDHPNLGKRGQTVKVADGYARNYLIPRNIAVINDAGNKFAVEAELQFDGIKKEKGKAAAEEIKEKIDGKKFEIKAKVGKEGKLYGSVTKQDIAGLLEKEGFNIDKKIMDVEDHIKEAGSYEIQLNLFEGVKAHINLLVEGESSGEKEKPSEKEKSPEMKTESSEEEKPLEQEELPTAEEESSKEDENPVEEKEVSEAEKESSEEEKPLEEEELATAEEESSKEDENPVEEKEVSEAEKESSEEETSELKEESSKEEN